MKVLPISDPKYVSAQYQNASSLNARIRLHQRFSTNPYGWHRWLFDQMKFPQHGCILELGCGPGSLWLDNLQRIPYGLELILSDFSPGMVIQARANLNVHSRFHQFTCLDAQSIPFSSGCFDAVIANHVLYHITNMEKALIEIQRVLRPGGRFYASTVGQNHLHELTELVTRFDPRLAAWGSIPADSFTLENGSEVLWTYFSGVSLFRYDDSLLITEVSPLMDYILSGRIEVEYDQRIELAIFVERVLKENNGKLFITKDSGVFESIKIEG